MEIKVIQDDFMELTRIEQSAYASSFKGDADERKRYAEIYKDLASGDDVTALGAYGPDLMGCEFHYDFTTNFHGHMIPTAGIGSLAVDLLHKKKGVAQGLIQASMDRAHEAGVLLYHLYPFSTEFYRNFGFGYGPQVFTYCAAPRDFKDMGDRSLLSYGGEADYEDIIAFHDQMATSTHGMSKKTSADRRRIHKMTIGKLLLAKDQGQLIGYMIYTQKGVGEGNMQRQKLVVSEMFYTPKALQAFCSFFNAQKDQVTYVEVATYDRHFHQMLKNTHFVPEPKTQHLISLKVSDHSLGLMPLALDPQGLLDLLAVDLPYKVVFHISHPQGEMKRASIGEGEEVHLNLVINEFSSWVTGVVSLESLYRTGQLDFDQPSLLRQLDRAFYFESPRSYVLF